MKQYKVIIIGAGGRGIGYAKIMAEMPEKYTVVGVADPIKERRDNLKNMFNFVEIKFNLLIIIIKLVGYEKVIKSYVACCFGNRLCIVRAIGVL